MSTRCLTVVWSRWGYDGDWKTRAVIYRHHDGYLCGHGKWLFQFLDGLEVINGIPENPPPRFANGPGRLAGQLVTELQLAGHDPDLLGEVCACGQEYQYEIFVSFGMYGGTVKVAVYDGPMTAFGAGGDQFKNLIFSGTVKEYGDFLQQAR